MKRKALNTTVCNFPAYPTGSYQDAIFKVPKNTEIVALYFDKNGHITSMIVNYEVNKVAVQMEFNHEWFTPPGELTKEL